MPKTLFFYRTSRNLFLALGLLLEGCFFQSAFISKAYAIDSNSPLFERDQKDNPAPKNESQSVDLPAEEPNPSPSLFATILRLLVALSVIIALILLTVWGLKVVWEKRGWNQYSEEGKPIKVLSSVFISPRKSVYLIEVGKRILVVGVGEAEMNCLDVIQNVDEVNALKHSTLQGFPKIFSRIEKRQETMNQEVEAQKIITESNQVVGDYVNKLKNLKKKKTGIDSNDLTNGES